MKPIKIIIPVIIILLLCGCELEETNTTGTTIKKKHTGKCLEYTTEYKLDCGLFVSKDSFCKERKYDVCVRWEDENN